jgi:nitric oxide reductase large subunit
MALTGGDKEYESERLKFILFTAGCGAAVGAGVGALRQRHTAPRVGYYVPGLFPETREWLENE